MGFGNLSIGGGAELTNIKSMSDAVGFAITLIFNVGLSIAIIFVIVGGIKLVTSSGDEGKFAEGRQTVQNAIIGIIVIIAFRVIVNFVLTLFGSQGIEKYLMEKP